MVGFEQLDLLMRGEAAPSSLTPTYSTSLYFGDGWDSAEGDVSRRVEPGVAGQRLAGSVAGGDPANDSDTTPSPNDATSMNSASGEVSSVSMSDDAAA